MNTNIQADLTLNVLKHERGEQEQLVGGIAEQEKLRMVIAEQLKLIKEREEQEKPMREREEQAQLWWEKEELKRLKIEREGQDKLIREIGEQERLKRERGEQQRLMREREEQEILTREREEQEILMREKEEQEKTLANVDEMPREKVGFWESLRINPMKINLDKIDKMEGKEFETCMKDVFEKSGYSVEETPYTGDQGADLILTKKGLFKKQRRIAVQVKRYSSKVSNKAVQEVVAAKAYYNCSEGIVVTNSYFTASAIKLAEVNDIKLIDRGELKKMI